MSEYIIYGLCIAVLILCVIVIHRECPNCAHSGPHKEGEDGYTQCDRCGCAWRTHK